MAGYPVAFTLAGGALIVAAIATAAGAFDPVLLLAFPQRIFAIMTNPVLVAVPLFIFMGMVLERSRIAAELLDAVRHVMGARRGAIGYAVCLVGALLAACTGIAGATVVTLGLLALPAMLRHGDEAGHACGLVCASGTLGQIIPPSIVLVLLGDQLTGAYQEAQFARGVYAAESVGVNELFAGALLPGIGLVGMYLVYHFLRGTAAVRRTHTVSSGRFSSGTRAPPADGNAGDTNRAAPAVTLAVFTPILLIIAVLGSIFAGLATPTEAASVGAVGALLLAGSRPDTGNGSWPVAAAMIGFAIMLIAAAAFDLRFAHAADMPMVTGAAVAGAAAVAAGVGASVWRLWQAVADDGSRDLITILRRTLIMTSMIFAIVIGASLFALVFRGLGGDVLIARLLGDLPGGVDTAVLAVMAAMFALGFVLDFLEILFVVVPVVAPALLQMEMAPGVTLHPVWLGVMMAVNLQTSFLTPPFGVSLFYLRGVAPASITTAEIYRGVAPFVAIQLLMLAVLWFWPGLATWLPRVLYGG